MPEELTDCPPSASFFLPDGVEYLCGHKTDFDWEAIGSPDIKRICTLAMSQHVWPDADSHSQSALLYQLLGPTPGTRRLLKDAHSALTDASNNLKLLSLILAQKPDIKTWAALYAYSEKCRIPLCFSFGKFKGKLISDIRKADRGYINWCLNQDFVRDDPYLRKALTGEA